MSDHYEPPTVVGVAGVHPGAAPGIAVRLRRRHDGGVEPGTVFDYMAPELALLEEAQADAAVAEGRGYRVEATHTTSRSAPSDLADKWEPWP